jgi:hypothetical protein
MNLSMPVPSGITEISSPDNTVLVLGCNAYYRTNMQCKVIGGKPRGTISSDQLFYGVTATFIQTTFFTVNFPAVVFIIYA